MGWLVIGIKREDKIRLRLPDGRDVWVYVAEMERGKVRLAFEAPLDVLINREKQLPPEEKHQPKEDRK